MTIYEALRAVVAECKSDAAKKYAKAALELGGSKRTILIQKDGIPGVFWCRERTGNPMEGEMLRVQIEYVLMNTDWWRGPKAREAKQVLKREVLKNHVRIDDKL